MLRVLPIDGRPGNTVRYTASDTSTGLPTTVLTDSGAECVGLLITIEDNPVRIALNDIAPTQGASPVGHLLDVGDVYSVFGNDLVSSFHYINANAGNNGVLQITPFYT